jgi:hypothetical protein
MGASSIMDFLATTIESENSLPFQARVLASWLSATKGSGPDPEGRTPTEHQAKLSKD